MSTVHSDELRIRARVQELAVNPERTPAHKPTHRKTSHAFVEIKSDVSGEEEMIKHERQ